MKSLLIGILGLFAFVLVPAVSFASDGPPTTKESVILDDVFHSSFEFTADAVTYNYVIVESELSGAVAVNDVGKYSDNSKHFSIDHFGLPSYFAWEAHGTNAWPYYNEWLTYKYELTVVHYSQPLIDKVDNVSRRNC